MKRMSATEEFARLVEESGLTRREVADLLHITERTVNSYYTAGEGARVPSPPVLELFRMKMAELRRPYHPSLGDTVWILDEAGRIAHGRVERVGQEKIFVKAKGEPLLLTYDLDSWGSSIFASKESLRNEWRRRLKGRVKDLQAELDLTLQKLEAIEAED